MLKANQCDFIITYSEGLREMHLNVTIECYSCLYRKMPVTTEQAIEDLFYGIMHLVHLYSNDEISEDEIQVRLWDLLIELFHD